jgi:hypothetical protein
LKKQQKIAQTTSPLTLRKETLRRLASTELNEVIGGVRIWKPVGFADDTTPIYDWVEV